LQDSPLWPLIPAKAGIQQLPSELESGLRRNDGLAVTPSG